MKEQRVQIEGKSIFFVTEGKGFPVLYLHGNTGSHLWFSKVMKLPGHTTIAPDMVNFGRSSRIEDSEISSYVLWMKRFLDHLGIEKCIIAGHSLGGAVAMGMAFTHLGLTDRLVLIDSCPIDGLVTPESHFPVIEVMKKDRSVLKQGLASVVPSLDDEDFLEKLVDDAMMMNPDSFTGHPRSLATVNYISQASNFSGKTLFILGRKDSIISEKAAENTMKYLKGTIKIVEDVGHSVIVEKPDTFINLVTAFIEG